MSLSRIDEAFALMAQGDASAAADVLRGVLRAAPGYTPAYVLCAQACEALHAWPEALRLWQAAHLLAPSLEVARQGALRATRVMAALRDLAGSEAEGAPPLPSAGLPPVAEPPPPPPAGPPALHPPAVAADLGPARAEPADRSAADDPLFAPVPPRWSRAGTFADTPEDAAPERTAPEEAPPEKAALEAAAPEDAGTEDAAPEAGVFAAPPPPPDVFDRGTPAPPSAESPAEAAEAPRSFDLDLDGLIEQLNTQGRIRPRPDLDSIPAPDLDDDGEDMVSETLARIYATQGQYDEAARIYELLAAQHPENADAYQREAQALRSRAGDE